MPPAENDNVALKFSIAEIKNSKWGGFFEGVEFVPERRVGG